MCRSACVGITAAEQKQHITGRNVRPVCITISKSTPTCTYVPTPKCSQYQPERCSASLTICIDIGRYRYMNMNSNCLQAKAAAAAAAGESSWMVGDLCNRHFCTHISMPSLKCVCRRCNRYPDMYHQQCAKTVQCNNMKLVSTCIDQNIVKFTYLTKLVALCPIVK